MSSRFVLALWALALCSAISSAAAQPDPFRLAASNQSVAAMQHVSEIPQHASATEQHISKALDELTEMEFPETPLKDVFDYIKERHHLEVQFDMKALGEANPKVDPSQTLITRTLKGVTLKSALRLILRDYDLSYVIKDEVLMITTKDHSLTPIIYDVRDVVANEDDAIEAAKLSQLADVIASTVESQSWKTNGGVGTIRPFNSNGACALFVAQTYDVHEQVEKALAELRAIKPQKAAKE